MNTEERKTGRNLSFLPYFSNFEKYIDTVGWDGEIGLKTNFLNFDYFMFKL